MERQFSKNDECFICAVCGKNVNKLGYTSRDHCPYCLCSLHVDINPGDRANQCKGVLKPIQANPHVKKGMVITYQCTQCKQLHNNKAATDDNKEVLLSVMNQTYDSYLKKLQ